MAYRISVSFLLALLAVSFASRVAAQTDDPMREGLLAFREGRYEEAAEVFQEVTEQDPNRAEAYFLLARVYAETPLKDRGRAINALDKALELDPDNVTYLVGRLQQLREESWNFFVEKIREQKRIELSQKILKLDSTNAFAHEELGIVHIRDFWRYRNAIMMPTMQFGGTAYTMHGAGGVMDDPSMRRMIVDDSHLDQVGHTLDRGTGEGPGELPGFDPNDVFLADQFDVDKLESAGVPVHNLAGRAHRAYERAIGHLNAALATDPRRRSVYENLMEIYALKGEYDEALKMLEEMYAFFPESLETWLYLGLSHYRTGNMEAAAKSFETALEYMSHAEREAFESLENLLPEDERRELEKDPVAYASRYWTSKDPRYLTPYNERKLEHYARLVYADLLYGSPDLDLRGWDTQRGRILVRYGVPTKDVVLIPGSTSKISSPSESPIARAQGSIPNEQGELDNTTSALPAVSSMDMFAEANAFNIWDYGDFRFVFEDPFRNGEYRLYSPSAREMSHGVPPWLNDYSIRAKETFAKVPDRYEYEAPGRQIEIPYLVNAFRSDDGNADLYVHYGIPISAEGADAETINVTANVGAFLISDRRDLLVERRRTVYGLKSEHVRSFKDASLWVDTQHMNAPAGKHQVSMEFETASGSTVAVQRREVDVPDFSSENLLISDVMLAYGVEEAYGEEASGGPAITRRGLSITPAPWSVFATEQPIYLYFEIYNLEKGAEGRTDYEMEARLTPQDDDKGIGGFFKNLLGRTDGVSVGLPGSGTASDEGHYLILDASNQVAGLYTLTLRVRDKVSGKSVERQKELFLE